MRTNTILAVVFIALGIVALTYHAITYKTTEKAVDLGPLHVTTEKTHTIPLPPILGGIALAGGIVLLALGARKN